MRTAMCFSQFQLSRSQVHTFTGSWWKTVHNFSQKGENHSKFHSVGPNICVLQGGHSKRLNNTEGKNIIYRRTHNISQQIIKSTPSSLITSGIEISECSKSVHIGQKIVENEDISKPVTVIVFDTETTGFVRDSERIIEIALRDLSGGENSTFETLINPDKSVTNTQVHGITNYMVKEKGVPRMKELIPILVQYINSRRKPGGEILLVAHNGKTFDVPFLKAEFKRCSYEIPSNWLFVDALSLARALIKLDGSKYSAKSLKALREFYGIPLNGNAHRAMADANVLALVLQRMSLDLKLTASGLLKNYSFSASDIGNNSKKNSK